MALTTIQVSTGTRARLNRLKIYKRATYDEIIGALIDLVPEGDDEGAYTDEFRASLLRSLLDVKSGRVHGAAEVRKRLGL